MRLRARRMRNEPISEIFQVKGSSETHPLLSDEDEFAGFEIYDTLLAQSQDDSRPAAAISGTPCAPGWKCPTARASTPTAFGVIGSSDGHNASAPVEENNYHGKLPLLDGSAALRMGKATFYPARMPGGARWSAAGLAAVWAQENTRESLLRCHAAPGNLRYLRTAHGRALFRWLELSPDLLEQDDWIDAAQRRCTHGRRLPAPQAAAPSFAVWAIRDPRQRQPGPHTDDQGLGRRRGNPGKRFSMSPGQANARSMLARASCRRWATRWTRERPVTATASARRNWPRSGLTPSLIPRRRRFTTPGS